LKITSSTNTHIHFYHLFGKIAWISYFLACGLDEISKTQSGKSCFEGLKGNIFKTYFYPKYILMSTFQPNLNHSIWIWNENFITKTLTGCLVGSSGIELGQSVFWGLNDYIFKTCFYPKYPLMSTFQPNFNHSIWIWNKKIITKTLTGCLVGSSRTDLRQSVFGGLNDDILKTCFYDIFLYESNLQVNLNYSFSITYDKVMTKILTVYRKSALLQLCFSGY